MVVVLSLIFGFRPQTVVALKLSDITYEGVELKFTEAFRKGYSNKNKAKRRLTYPYSNFPALKTLLEVYRKQNPGDVWVFRGNMAPATYVESCLRWIEKAFKGLDLSHEGKITAYSLRISCCSYLFAHSLPAEKIKLWMGWALDSV